MYRRMQWIPRADTVTEYHLAVDGDTATWVGHKIITLRERSRTKESTDVGSTCAQLCQSPNCPIVVGLGPRLAWAGGGGGLSAKGGRELLDKTAMLCKSHVCQNSPPGHLTGYIF